MSGLLELGLAQLERWDGETEDKDVWNSGYLMMVVRQSTRSCFFCLETGPSMSGISSSEVFGSSLEDFFFGSSLG